MPGAGSMIAMNHIYGVAKPDGLTLVMPNYGVYLDQIAGRKEVRFDVTKGHFIGSPEKSDIILYARADAPFKALPGHEKTIRTGHTRLEIGVGVLFSAKRPFR